MKNNGRKSCLELERNSAASGFTLPEALVAISIVGIVFTALYSAMTYGFASTTTARENVRATQILQDRLETLRLYTWDQINSTNFISAHYALPISPGQTNRIYDETVTITKPSFSQPYTNDLRQITIEVTWTNGSTRCSRKMVSLVTRYGLQNYFY
jgi:prepilin-type N-terminal cleavage/methylation domain-containing protein